MARRRITSFGVTVAVVVITLLRLLVAQDPIAQTLNNVVSPIANQLSFLQFSGAGSTEEPLKDIELQALAQENAQLKAELALPGKTEQTLIKAEIILKNIQTYRQLATVALSDTSGIKKGNAVLYDGQLIGVVNEVFEVSASIRFITDPDFRVAAIVPKNGAEGIVKTDAGSLLLTQVSVNDNSVTGQVIQTSGLGGVFPPNISIGEVGTLLSEEESALGTYVVRKALPFGEMRYVDVVVSGER